MGRLICFISVLRSPYAKLVEWENNAGDHYIEEMRFVTIL